MENSALSGQLAQNYLQVPAIKPFENIALAFSGGGFRAATFALGVLSYLNEVKCEDRDDPPQAHSLLHHVTYISSASGGTITAALYSLYNAQGKTFGQFYVKLFETLTGDRILQDALTILNDKKSWPKDWAKSRNIINAFAVAYDKFIFEGHTLQSLVHNQTGVAHLQEVCFNATEFFTGLSYRQDIKLVPDAGEDRFYKFGNENIFLGLTTAAKLKLGDVLAASSCFPAGFEPIIFPGDFTYGNLNEAELKAALTLQPQTGDKEEQQFIAEKRIGLMDGGITDNQGLQSMMYADGRRIRHETTFANFDFMLVNDVGSYFMKPYIMPEQAKSRGLSLTGLYWIIFFFFVASATCAILGVYHHKAWLALVGGAFSILPLIFIALVRWLRNQIMGVSDPSSALNLTKSFTEKIVRLLLHYFTKTPLSVLKQMLIARADSVLMLNMNVFMKRIRQLLYNKFYDSPEWKNRGKGNHIYDLSFSNDLGRKKYNPPPPHLQPNRNLKIVAQTAFNMGTTLWFDKQNIDQQHSEACIIACGQFTTCYNLLQYTERLLANPPSYDPAYKNRLLSLQQQMHSDYVRFKTDPFFMYNEKGREYQVRDFKPVNVKDIPFPKNWAQLENAES